MSLVLYFSIIYIILFIVAFIFATRFYNIYQEMPIYAFKQYIYLALSIALFSIVYTLNYYFDVRIVLGTEKLYLMDTIMTLFALLTVYFFFKIMESARDYGYTWRLVFFCFLLGGAFVGELLENGPFSYVVSGGIEIFGMFFFLYVFGLYLKEIKPYVKYPNLFKYSILGFLLMITGAIQGTLLGAIDVFYNEITITVLAETWGIVFIAGMLLVLYIAFVRPLSVISVVAEPTVFVIMSNEGEVLYYYFFKKNLNKLERKDLIGLVSGIFLTVRSLQGGQCALEKLKTKSYSILGYAGRYVTGLFLVGKETEITHQLVSMATEIFDHEVGQYIKEKKLKEINVEELGRFDHIVKYYFEQVAR